MERPVLFRWNVTLDYRRGCDGLDDAGAVVSYVQAVRESHEKVDISGWFRTDALAQQSDTHEGTSFSKENLS